MRNIRYIIGILLSVACFTGCVGEEKDLFDTPSLERLYRQAMENQALLQSASNGWVFDYYPETNQSSGGYTMLVKFNEDGTVTVAGDTNTSIPAKQPATSEFSVEAELGVLVKFNTWNPVLHYFCDPSSSDVDGMAGDWEFRIVSATRDAIELRGKKYGNLMHLYPLPENKSWDEYLQNSIDLRAEIDSPRYLLETGGQTYTFYRVGNKFVYDYKLANGANMSYNMPFVTTETGIRFYDTIDRFGVEFRNFTFDPANERFVGDDSSLEIRKHWLGPAGTLAETKETWFIVADESHPIIQEIMDIRWTGTSWVDYFVDDITFGNPPLTGYASFGLSVYLNALTRHIYGIWSITAEVLDDDLLSFVSFYGAYNTAENSVGGGYGQRLVDLLLANDPYIIGLNDDRSPTEITMVSRDDPSVYFVLRK